MIVKEKFQKKFTNHPKNNLLNYTRVIFRTNCMYVSRFIIGIVFTEIAKNEILFIRKRMIEDGRFSTHDFSRPFHQQTFYWGANEKSKYFSFRVLTDFSDQQLITRLSPSYDTPNINNYFVKCYCAAYCAYTFYFYTAVIANGCPKMCLAINFKSSSLSTDKWHGVRGLRSVKPT
ncbi:uncharacterized protein LOC143430496 [Xylocopa sonorina]|uniref:uncharacterized protein LOC143430496 n=1 Tax=Xylocopa sonorina TaxID=1818115 RepID=UPI00403AF0EC